MLLIKDWHKPQTDQLIPGFSSPSSPFPPSDSITCCFCFVAPRGRCLLSFDRFAPSWKKKGSWSQTSSLPLHLCTSGASWAALYFSTCCTLTGRASATMCGTRCEVAHVHGGVEPSYHSVDSLIQPRRLDQIRGSQLVRICLNYFNAWTSHWCSIITSHKHSRQEM